MLKKNNFKEKRKICVSKFILFSFFIGYSFCFSAQNNSESIALTEEKDLEFQGHFFNAITQKSIGNYQKSIESLESCNQVLADNEAVFFEFSKNYFHLSNLLLAKNYIEKALRKDPDNIWMQKHLVKIHVKNLNFTDAIKIQQKLAVNNIKEKSYLVRLYLQNKNYKKASLLINEIEKRQSLSYVLKNIKSSLVKKNTKKSTKTNNSTKEASVTDLKEKFKTEKTYAILKKILILEKENTAALLKYSEEGISLFPAQPYVYLVKGTVLNSQKEYDKALTSLKNGIDFVIEEKMEVDFYKEMAKSYNGLGNLKEAKKVTDKWKKMK